MREVNHPKRETTNPNNLSDYIAQRAGELGLERMDELAQIQLYFDGRWPNMARALSIQNGTLTVQITSSSISSELRYSWLAIQKQFPDIVLRRFKTVS